MRPVPAGRQRGQCCTPYSRLQEEIDNVETIAVTANNTANNAMNAATIQAGNAAQSAQNAQNSADAAAASAAAVAGALDDKVDKLTTANLKAYTHNGSTQGEKAVVDGTTADTIPIRDANGYVQGATNTTGTRDNVLTNGTRVQNDLDAYAPMVRTTGAQTIDGIKEFNNGVRIHALNFNRSFPTADGNWYVAYKSTSAVTQNTQYLKAIFFGERYRGIGSNADFGLGEIYHQGLTEAGWRFYLHGSSLDPDDFKALIINNVSYFYVKKSSAATRWMMNMLFIAQNGSALPVFEAVNEKVTDATLIAQIEAAPGAILL